MGKGRLSTIICTCEKCGIEFHPWHNKRPNRFCSRACAPQGRQPTKPDQICEHCGVLFRAVNNVVQKYCSRKCYRDAGEYRRKDTQGYVLVWAPNEPGAYINGQIKEHRLVMQRHLGRALERHETIHHINGNKSDNRIENLQLRTGRHGNGQIFVCLDCGSHNIGNEPV